MSCPQIVLKKKAVDDIMGGEDAWANVDKTQVCTAPYGITFKCTYLYSYLGPRGSPASDRSHLSPHKTSTFARKRKEGVPGRYFPDSFLDTCRNII